MIQHLSFKFQALDFKEAMKLMAEIGEINILVGEDVAGAITAELDNVPWDKAFNALLDLKNYAADIDVASNIIRVSTPANLTSQEGYKSARASAVKKKVELEDSVEPIISEIFRLYYITPTEAKATITELFTTVGTSGNYIPIQVTEETTTRSIIVRGKEKDLDIVYKVMFLFFVVIGASISLGAVIDFSDAMIFAMVFPNIIGLIILAPKVSKELSRYKAAIKKA